MGDKNPNYKYPAVFYNCAYCGKEKRVTGHALVKSEIYFCNIRCKAAWQREHAVKEQNPFFIYKDKIRKTMIERYGGTGGQVLAFREKSIETQERNGTLGKSLKHNHSKIGDEFCKELAKCFPGHKCYCGKKETFLRDGARIFFFDFEVRDLKVFVEFNGDYFHANPEMYQPNDILKFYGGKIFQAFELWEKDKVKKDVALEKGYHLITVWEKDYRSNKEKIIEMCVEEINNMNIMIVPGAGVSGT